MLSAWLVIHLTDEYLMFRMNQMTTERYKVLGAVLALKEFTVADLATFSGVKPNTVRTVLGREPELVDEIGKRETGAKGGQFTRYHIRSDAIDRLRSELHGLYRQFETYVDKDKDKEDVGQSTGEKVSKYQPPLAILAAEEALIRRFPKASDRSAKVQLIEFVRTVRPSSLRKLARNRTNPRSGQSIGTFTWRPCEFWWTCVPLS